MGSLFRGIALGRLFKDIAVVPLFLELREFGVDHLGSQSDLLIDLVLFLYEHSMGFSEVDYVNAFQHYFKCR